MTLEGQDKGSLSYRPEIDGLRAVAVISVMLFHARPSLLTGGFAGVDVFFVISGYLITRIIGNAQAEHRFTLVGFYLNRARRILPALTAVMVAALVAVVLICDPPQAQAFGRNFAAAALFLANVYSWREGGGYFSLDASQMPLSHLWSLAVEEQFYLLYPLLLIALLKFFPKRAWIALAALGLASLLAAEVLNGPSPAVAYYMLPTRAWELLAGCVLAAIPGKRQMRHEGLAGCGAALIGLTFFFLDSGVPFPGVAAVPVVVGTMLVIQCAAPGTIVGRALGSTPLRRLGLISYSAFLWHQPLLAFVRIYPLNQVSAVVEFAMVPAAFLLAWPTWRWIEQPFRRNANAGRALTRIFLPILAALFLAGIWLSHSGGWPERFSPRARGLYALASAYSTARARCDYSAAGKQVEDGGCVLRPDGDTTTAIFGDSHAAALAPGFVASAQAKSTRLILFSVSGCAPIYDLVRNAALGADCSAVRTRIASYLIAHREITTVILAARWTSVFSGGTLDNAQGGIGAHPRPVPSDAQSAERLQGLRSMIVELLRSGKQIVLVYPIPEAGWDVPKYLAKADRRGIPAPELSIDRSIELTYTAPARAALDAIGTMPGLTRLDPLASLCAERCALNRRWASLYADDHHLTSDGAKVAVGGGRSSAATDK